MSKPQAYDDYRESLPKYVSRNAIHIIPAIIVAYVTDETAAKIQDKFKLHPITMIIVQFIFIIFVMYAIERILSKRYNREWRGKTPSILLVFIFFPFQVTLFKNLLAVKQNMSFVKV